MVDGFETKWKLCDKTAMGIFGWAALFGIFS